MKISLSPNIIELLFFYLFGVLYLQIIELILPFTLTKFVFLIVLMVILINILKKKFKANMSIFLITLGGIIYLGIYLFTLK